MRQSASTLVLLGLLLVACASGSAPNGMPLLKDTATPVLPLITTDPTPNSTATAISVPVTATDPPTSTATSTPVPPTATNTPSLTSTATLTPVPSMATDVPTPTPRLTNTRAPIAYVTLGSPYPADCGTGIPRWMANTSFNGILKPDRFGSVNGEGHSDLAVPDGCTAGFIFVLCHCTGKRAGAGLRQRCAPNVAGQHPSSGYY